MRQMPSPSRLGSAPRAPQPAGSPGRPTPPWSSSHTRRGGGCHRDVRPARPPRSEPGRGATWPRARISYSLKVTRGYSVSMLCESLRPLCLSCVIRTTWPRSVTRYLIPSSRKVMFSGASGPICASVEDKARCSCSPISTGAARVGSSIAQPAAEQIVIGEF